MELNPKYPTPKWGGHRPPLQWAIKTVGAVCDRALVIATIVTLCITATPAAAQAPAAGLFPAYTAPRAIDGKPNLNGIWQAFITANWDVEAHPAQAGPHPEIMGVWGAGPGGQSIVEGGVIPYKPEALAKKKENLEKRTAVKATNVSVEIPQGT